MNRKLLGKVIPLLALLTVSIAATACTGANRNTDFPDPPIRRGSF